MFVQSWGNLLDRDLANQNSLQKLSDPGGSRALDKQDWLFQRHAYITPIWAQAISHRQLREYKPDSYRRILQENMARSVDFFMQGKQALWDISYKLLKPRHMTDTMLNVLSPVQKIHTDRIVCQGLKWKEQLSCSFFILNVDDDGWQQNTENIKNGLKISQPSSHPSFNMKSGSREGNISNNSMQKVLTGWIHSILQHTSEDKKLCGSHEKCPISSSASH